VLQKNSPFKKNNFAISMLKQSRILSVAFIIMGVLGGVGTRIFKIQVHLSIEIAKKKIPKGGFLAA
jgi:hypothetical protein